MNIALYYSTIEKQIRDEITGKVAGVLNLPVDVVTIDYPPQAGQGDFTVPCFTLGKSLGQPPVAIAERLAAGIKPNKTITSIVAAGPYVNITVNREVFAKGVLREILKNKQKYGVAPAGETTVMVEYFSPNTNKPLTIGHVRNICLGSSISQLLLTAGVAVKQTSLYNDRGIAIAKTIVGYQKWGEGKTPKQAKLKPDHFVGNFYVRFNQEAKDNPELDKEALKILQKWERGDKVVRDTWQQLMEWVLEGFEQTLYSLGVQGVFNEKFFESEFYQHGKEIVNEGLERGIFKKEKDGVVVAPLEQYNLPDKVLLRPNETSLYITQDLYLAKLKEQSQVDESIYVVGDEQELYLRQLFAILELLGLKSIEHLHHLSYAMIRLPDGKIKSREGLVKGTGADELLAELEALAADQIKSREKDLPARELKKRSHEIALAALKFYILQVDPKKTMTFDPGGSIAFVGKTGPYLQYVGARINGIFAKTKKRPSLANLKSITNNESFALVALLSRYPLVVSTAAKGLNPALLANYLYDLAKSFSAFYEAVPVASAEKSEQQTRLALLRATQIVLGNGLELLGITPLKKM